MPIQEKRDDEIFPCGQTRREFVWEMGAGFTGLALASLLSADGFFARHASAQGTGRNHPNPQSLIPNPSPERWRVTAILGGSHHPTAVLESPEMSPRTVAVGDEVQGFRIAAIRTHEIVVASARTVLTLPLETHGDNGDNPLKIEQQGNKETKTLTAIQPPKSAEKPNEKSSN